MAKTLEVILDTKPSGGCGCNCGCGGASVVEDINDLVSELKGYQFSSELDVDLLSIDSIAPQALISKINSLLDNTKATFRVDETNLEETLSNILPMIVLEDEILTAFGVPTLHDVVSQVEKNL